MIASSVSSMPSNAADWSAANAVSPVTMALSGTIARIVATSRSTTWVASSRVWTVTSATSPSGVTGPTAGLEGATLFSSEPHAIWYGVMTRSTSGTWAQIAAASASIRVAVLGREAALALVGDDRVDLGALREALLDQLCGARGLGGRGDERVALVRRRALEGTLQRRQRKGEHDPRGEDPPPRASARRKLRQPVHGRLAERQVRRVARLPGCLQLQRGFEAALVPGQRALDRRARA